MTPGLLRTLATGRRGGIVTSSRRKLPDRSKLDACVLGWLVRIGGRERENVPVVELAADGFIGLELQRVVAMYSANSR